MSVAVRTGKSAIRLASGVINTSLLTVILILLTFACYSIWDTNQVHHAADATNYEKYKPTVVNESVSFEELRAVNPEVFAWLTVYGTHIDYPMTQGKDNLKYVNTDALGNYSLSGAIFLDSQCSPDFSDFSNIVFGHHMEKQTMFGEIGLFTDESYFNARRYGMLYYEGIEHGLEFFAFVHTDAYDRSVFHAKITEPEEQQMYLDMLLQKAIHIRKDVSVTIDDRLVLLSTCSETSTNGRDLLIGRITDKAYDDPFIEPAAAPKKFPANTIDKLSSLYEQAPAWVKLIAMAMSLLLIFLIIRTIIVLRKRKRVRTLQMGGE